MLCILVSCLIGYNRFGITLIVAQHVNVLIVGLHEITLAGNLLHCLRVFIQLTDLRLVTLVCGIVLVNLLFQLADTTLVLEVIPDTVLVEESHNEHAQQDDHRIFHGLRTPYFQGENFDIIHYFHKFVCKVTQFQKKKCNFAP